MATAYYNTSVDQTSDAGFRAWIQEFSDALTSVGLSMTGDTGQIVIGTATRPGSTNTSAGYQIRVKNTTGAPALYIKFEYGQGGAIDIPMIWVTVGRGTDGAGNITGIQFARQAIVYGSSPVDVRALHPTYICNKDGVFWFMWKAGYAQAYGSYATQGMFFLSHSVDESTGLIDGDGVFYNYRVSSNLSYSSFVSNAANTLEWSNNSLGSTCLVIGNTLNQYYNRDFSLYMWKCPTKEIRPVFGLLGGYATDGILDDTINIATVNATENKFICLGRYAYGTSALSSSVQFLLWE